MTMGKPDHYWSRGTLLPTTNGTIPATTFADLVTFLILTVSELHVYNEICSPHSAELFNIQTKIVKLFHAYLIDQRTDNLRHKRFKSHCSAFSLVSVWGRDVQNTTCWLQTARQNFQLVQTKLAAHPMGIGGSFLGDNATE